MTIHEMKIENVSKKFKRKEAIKSVSCRLESGVYGLLGPNGAGKTTLMRSIANFYSYTGKIELDGKSMRKISSSEIGYLPQKFDGYPELTVCQMLEYFCNLKKIPRKERREQIKNCLSSTNLLEVENKKIKTLSGGMIRRLGIAQAVLGDPAVVLLDEPTAGLDPEERMRFKNVITNISKDRIVVISTHIVEDVEVCCNNIIVMNQGNVIYADTINELCNYAQGRVQELTEEEMNALPEVYVEKAYLKDSNKVYRVITKEKEVNSAVPTIEDGYICLLKMDC